MENKIVPATQNELRNHSHQKNQKIEETLEQEREVYVVVKEHQSRTIVLFVIFQTIFFLIILETILALFRDNPIASPDASFASQCPITRSK